jgi:putative transposase
LDNVMYVHDRRSLRLNGYDYAQAGAYFVTICTQDRACLFGDVADGEMRLNDAGRMVRSVWEALPDRFPRTGLDAFVVMPNHVHRIIVIAGPCPVVGAGPRACPDPGQTETVPPVGAGLALPEENGAAIPGRGESCIRPDDFRRPGSGDHKDRPYGTNRIHAIAAFVRAGLALPEEKGAASSAPTLGDLVRTFKSMSAIRVNRLLMRSGPLWQRNYYEHVVRNERELDQIREYIVNNPLKWALDRENP